MKKRLIAKSVLACEEEILNTTETSIDDKKVTCEKSNCLIHTISLYSYYYLSFLLVVITIIQKTGQKRNMYIL